MADIPRDPRQLARDILSGKVRIEDLARERQMRQGGQVPAKIPLPRPPAQAPPAPPPPMRARLPQQRPQPQRMPQQQRPQPQRQIPSGRAPAPRQQPGRLVVTVPPPAQRIPQPPEPPQAPSAPAEPGAKPPAKRRLRVGALVHSKLALRQGVLLAEILGKPIALREIEGGN